MQGISSWVRGHSTAVGITLMVVAGAALVVAAVVVMGGTGEPVASASTSPSADPSGTPRESATPDASPTALPSAAPAWHGYQLTDVATPIFNGVWVRVTVDRLNVRTAANDGADVAGVALMGDLLLVSGDPDGDGTRQWAPVVGNGVSGWVATNDAEDAYLQPVATPWLFGARRELVGLAAGPNGLLAYGGASDLDVIPYEGTGVRSLVYASADGRSWTAVPNLGGPASTALAGSGMYVLANEPSYIEPNVVRVSTDGQHWSEPAVLTDTARSAAWGPAGAVLLISGWDGGVRAANVAADGTVAETKVTEAEELLVSRLEGSSAAYVAFDPGNAPQLLVSLDGVAWQAASVPGAAAGDQAVRDVELDGSRLIVVVVDTGTGATSLRTGRIGSGGGVSWDAARTAPFGSATIDSITLGNGTFLALGWDSDSLVPRAWRSTDAVNWTDLLVAPTSFGGAIGPEPVYADGRWYAATDAVYASDDGASWEEVFRPPAPAPVSPGCPPADQVTALDIMFLGPEAADCYGNTPLRIRSWIIVPDGLGGCCWPLGLPEWLNATIPPGFLSAAPGTYGYPSSLGVYPVPGLADAFRTEGWAQVTGHFHDPAAQECRHVPLTAFPHRLEAKSVAVANCERRFVVERVEPLDG